MKPWGKLEIGYLDHPKFLALNANAICLWHEGKQYCDKFHTDGLIPKDAVKRFRFNGSKSIALLMASCGPKGDGDGTPYAPLWEGHLIGYRMHDYLDHNDCREEALARMDDADEVRELRKLKNRQRQAEFRANRRRELEELERRLNHDGPPVGVPERRAVTEPVSHVLRNVVTNALVTHVTSTPTETATETATTTVQERTFKAAAAPPLALAKEPNANGNYRVIEKLAIDLLNERSFDSEGDLIDATKGACALLNIDYGRQVDRDVVHRACASALIKHRNPGLSSRTAH